jgi:hypothetical protein
VARTAASEVLQQDERLVLQSNAILVEQLRLLDEMDANYSRVS